MKQNKNCILGLTFIQIINLQIFADQSEQAMYNDWQSIMSMCNLNSH